MKKKEILFITTQLPFPPKSGGTIKSFNYVKFLSTHYNLTVASLLKDDDEIHLEKFEEEFQLGGLITEEVNIERSPLNLIKSYISAPCLNVFRNYSADFAEKLAPFLSRIDFVIIDHYEVFQYVPAEYRGRVIMHTHNAEFMLWQRMGELTNNPIKKIILGLEAKRVKKYEKEIFDRSILIYSTPSDIELYSNHGFDVSKHKVTYHLGNDSMLQLPDLDFNKTEISMTFIGTLNWEPNIDGICWFIDNCWSKIKENHPSIKLYILGKNPDARILKSAKNDSGIVFTGFVKDLDTYLQKTRVYITPLRFGSGMKVKVLEGLYRGTPCVTTSVGAEGLELINGENIIIADKPSEFISGCLTLLEDESKWVTFRDKVRKLAAEKYTWKALFARMDNNLKEVL